MSSMTASARSQILTGHQNFPAETQQLDICIRIHIVSTFYICIHEINQCDFNFLRTVHWHAKFLKLCNMSCGNHFNKHTNNVFYSKHDETFHRLMENIYEMVV